MQLNDDSAEAEHGFVELFAWNGAIGAFWLDGRQLAEWSFDEPDKLLGTSLRVAELDYSGNVVAREIVDELVCDCCQPDRAMTSVGPRRRVSRPDARGDPRRRRAPPRRRRLARRRRGRRRRLAHRGLPRERSRHRGRRRARRRRMVHGRRRRAARAVRALGRRRRELRARARPRRCGLVRPSRPRARRRRHGEGHVVARRDRAAARISCCAPWRSTAALGEPRVLAHSGAVQPVDVPQVVAVGEDLLDRLDEPRRRRDRPRAARAGHAARARIPP